MTTPATPSAPTPLQSWYCNKCRRIGDAESREQAEKQHALLTPQCDYLPAWGYTRAVEMVTIPRAEYDALRSSPGATPTEGERSGCPCSLIKPCCVQCSCADEHQSGGCQRCAQYGSMEQRVAMAHRLASHSRDAALGAALREALATVPNTMDYHLVITSAPHDAFTGVRNPNNYIVPNDATSRLAAQLRAVTTGETT